MPIRATSVFVDAVGDFLRAWPRLLATNVVYTSRMMSRGVDGVITDHPALAREVLARRAELNVAERLMMTAAFWMGLEPEEPPPRADGA